MNVVITVSETEVFEMNARKFADDKRCRALVSLQILRCERSGRWAMTLIHHRPRWKEQIFSALRLGLCNCWSKVGSIARSDTKWGKQLGTFFSNKFESLKVWNKIIRKKSSLWGRKNGPPADRTTFLWENMPCMSSTSPWRLPLSVARAVPCLSGAMPWSTPVPRAAAGRRPCSS